MTLFILLLLTSAVFSYEAYREIKRNGFTSAVPYFVGLFICAAITFNQGTF